MTWETTFYYLPQYKHVSCNQHGDRFKKTGSKVFRIARLTCKTGNEADISCLILLSHSLNAPVHYDFEKHNAYIEVMSADVVRNRI